MTMEMDEIVLMSNVRKKVPEPALYEALAEECTELAQAALKHARLLRGENPTPLTAYLTEKSVIEEATDVLICLDVLGIQGDPETREAKLKRWDYRVDHKDGVMPDES